MTLNDLLSQVVELGILWVVERIILRTIVNVWKIMLLFTKIMMTFKNPTRLHLYKTRFDKTMSLSKPNKLPQERNSYLISFPRWVV